MVKKIARRLRKTMYKILHSLNLDIAVHFRSLKVLDKYFAVFSPFRSVFP